MRWTMEKAEVGGKVITIRALTRREVREISQRHGWYGDAFLQQLLEPMLNSSIPATAAGQVVIHLAELLRKRTNETIPAMQEDEVMTACSVDCVVGKEKLERAFLDALAEPEFQALRRAVLRQSAGVGDPMDEIRAGLAEALPEIPGGATVLPIALQVVDDVATGRKARDRFFGRSAADGEAGASSAPP